jgi:hypothetical protein
MLEQQPPGASAPQFTFEQFETPVNTTQSKSMQRHEQHSLLQQIQIPPIELELPRRNRMDTYFWIAPGCVCGAFGSIGPNQKLHGEIPGIARVVFLRMRRSIRGPSNECHNGISSSLILTCKKCHNRATTGSKSDSFWQKATGIQKRFISSDTHFQ